MNLPLKQKSVITSVRWMVSGFPTERKEPMNPIIKRSTKPGSVYYANIRHDGVRLRDCLKTSDRREAMRRLMELQISVERGEYQKGNIKFEKLVLGFTNPSVRDESIIRLHLVPYFKGTRVWDLDIDSFLDSISTTQSQSSINKICATMRKLGLECPRGLSKLPVKCFDGEKILSVEQVENVINNFIPAKYWDFCWLAAWTMLRMKDIAELRKKEVQFTGDKPGIRLVPSKTKEKNPAVLFIPMNERIRETFTAIKVWPLHPEDLWFPDINRELAKAPISYAFTKAGIPWGSFAQLRHFGACYLVSEGERLEVIQRLMHHKSIKTTQIYARVVSRVLAETMSSFDKIRTQVGHKVGAK